MEKVLENRDQQILAAAVVLGVFSLLLIPNVADAATTGGAFQAFYDFVFDAATGYLGRAVAIVGGIVGLIYGAVSGKLLLGASGIGLGAFGILGPSIVNTLFNSAIV